MKAIQELESTISEYKVSLSFPLSLIHLPSLSLPPSLPSLGPQVK